MTSRTMQRKFTETRKKKKKGNAGGDEIRWE